MDFKELFPVFSYWCGKKLTVLSTFPYRKNPIEWTKKKYYKRFKHKLDLDNPKTFYEKINYWKHFKYQKEQDELTDKLLVKDVLAKNGYGDWCAKCFFKTDNVKEFKKWIKENNNK